MILVNKKTTITININNSRYMRNESFKDHYKTDNAFNLIVKIVIDSNIKT